MTKRVVEYVWRQRMQTVVPMLQVVDVGKTIDWYVSIGFALIRTNEEDDEINWAKLSFGNSEVMFQSGGRTSTDHRREVDLYVLADNVDEMYQRLKDQVEVVAGPDDTFYGMREFVIRDVNRFWISFGQPLKS